MKWSINLTHSIYRETFTGGTRDFTVTQLWCRLSLSNNVEIILMNIRRGRKYLASTLAEQNQIELTVEEMTFVIELIKDGNVARASRIAGWTPDKGYKKRDDPRIQFVINEARQQAFNRSVLSVEWIMEEAEDLYHIAKQEGDIKAGISALTMIGKLAPVDAFASSKVEVSTVDKIDRLRAARLRAAQGSSEGDDDVSFF